MTITTLTVSKHIVITIFFLLLGNHSTMAAPPQSSTIQGGQTYQEPPPYIGFWVFMEMVEEWPQEKIRKGAVGPAGTIHLKGALYLDKQEVSNFAWLEYRFWIKEHQPVAYVTTALDTTVWLPKDSTWSTPANEIVYDCPSYPTNKKSSNLASEYHLYAPYHNYPVVGVTQEQAKAYCQWRTDRVNEMMCLKPKLQKKYGKVLYRLPTEKEWEYAASGGLDRKQFPYGYKDIKNKRGKAVTLLAQEESKIDSVLLHASTYQEAVPLVPVGALTPNALGFYNMIGNVAELVEEPHLAKGGSWVHSKAASKVTNQLYYEQPTVWLGFRCLCEVGL